MMATRKSVVYILFSIYLIVGIVMLFLVGINTFNKVNKLNLTKTEAVVLGGDWDQIRSHRGGSYSTYELFLMYEDNKEEVHITKKAVTRTTYNNYEQLDKVTLYYRNSNEYDTFIQVKSMKEFVFAFVNMFTIILALYIFSIIYIIRHKRKKRITKHDEEQENKILL